MDMGDAKEVEESSPARRGILRGKTVIERLYY